MPRFGLLWACVEDGRIINGKPAHDDPAHWVRRIHREIPADRSANIRFEDAGEGWAVHFQNLKTAAVAIWRYRGNVRAVGLVTTGLSDAVDADAIGRCVKAASDFFPAQSVQSSVAALNRPASLQFAADRGAFSNRLLNTISIALAMALFEQVMVTTTRPPLASNSRSAAQTLFAARAYAPDGRLLWTRERGWSDVVADSLGREMTASYDQSLKGSDGRWEGTVGVNDQNLKLIWQPFGKAAGAAVLYHSSSANEPESTLLVLTGFDFLDDQAAIEAYETQVAGRGMSGAWSKAFRQIAAAQRPLMVRFLGDRVKPTAIGEKAAMCFAAAFFRHKKVL
jgi:hypothetical protein